MTAGQSRSSTCAHSRPWTPRPFLPRCARPAAASSSTRRSSPVASGPRPRPRLPRSASTTSRPRCFGLAPTPLRIRRPGWRTTTSPTWTGSWTPSTAASVTERPPMADIKEFKLPDVGEGLTEADIVRWHVKAGDTVIVNQIIVEIETAKAVVELPSPFEGVVASLLVPEGQTADVGTPIISVSVGADASAVIAVEAEPADAASAVDAVPREALVQRAISETEDLVPSPPIEGAIEPGMHGSPAPKAERQ